MRTAVIADIHGNYDGLMAVLDDIDRRNCSRTVCLGDLVNGGGRSNEVVAEICRRGVLSVRGNHDEVGVDAIEPWAKEYVMGLPTAIAEGDVIFTHISPRKNPDYIRTPIDAWNVFDDTSWRLVFVGHVHSPAIFGAKCERPVSATVYPVTFDFPLALDPQDRYVISIGAVGYSRDATAKPSYCIYDEAAQTVEMCLAKGKLIDMFP